MSEKQKCKHENLTPIGWDEKKRDRHKKYEISLAQSRETNQPTFDVEICDECGALIECYHGTNPMTSSEIADWIDSLLEIQRNKIIELVDNL